MKLSTPAPPQMYRPREAYVPIDCLNLSIVVQSGVLYWRSLFLFPLDRCSPSAASLRLCLPNIDPANYASGRQAASIAAVDRRRALMFSLRRRHASRSVRSLADRRRIGFHVSQRRQSIWPRPEGGRTRPMARARWVAIAMRRWPEAIIGRCD